MSSAATDERYDDARIVILDEDLDPGDDEVPVQFNPDEVSVDKGVTYAEHDIPGLDAPLQQFVSGDAETLSVELFFDVYEPRDGEAGVDDVRELTDRVTALVMVDGDRHAPPLVKFVWGTLSFASVIESANTTYTMFRRDGTPVRARMDVTFREYTPPAVQLAGEPRHSPDTTSIHRVIEGDTLPGIAALEYDDPERWRHIALANGIVNPRRLEPGTELTIPPLRRS